MDKIIYRKISIINDSLAISELCLVVQELINKQAEIVEFIDGLQKLAEKQEIIK